MIRVIGIRTIWLSLSICSALLAQATEIDALWDFEQPTLSAQRFAQALQATPSEDEQWGELLSQLARAQGLQGQFAQAEQTLAQLQTRLSNLSPLVSVRYLLERGRLLNSQGQAPAARRWFRSAMLLAQKNQMDFFVIDAMHMLAITETGKAALDWNRKALDLLERSRDPSCNSWRGSLHNNLGWAYFDQQDYPKALEQLRLAQAWQEQQGAAKPLLIARWSVAKVLRMSNEPAKALQILFDLERAWKKLGEEDAYVLEEIAESLWLLGERSQARPYFGRAAVLLAQDSWLVSSAPARIQRLRELAQTP